MCVNCENEGIGRRDFMRLGAAGAVALGLGGVSGRARAAEGAPTGLPPEDALAQLKAGNERFVSHPELCSVNLAESRSAVAGHQAPWATIVSCADSRVPPELIFGGHGVGELFVSRDAGNLDQCRLPRHRRIWRGRARLSAGRRPRPHRLRRGEGRLRCRDQERDLSRRHRPHDRADRAGGARGARPARRLRRQRRQGEREAHRRQPRRR